MRTLQLQSIGHVPAKAAGELNIGDILLWNFGHKSQVKEITKQTSKSIWIKEECLISGDLYDRRFLKTRLVGIAN